VAILSTDTLGALARFATRKTRTPREHCPERGEPPPPDHRTRNGRNERWSQRRYIDPEDAATIIRIVEGRIRMRRVVRMA
jgi:hypothetical protein